MSGKRRKPSGLHGMSPRDRARRERVQEQGARDDLKQRGDGGWGTGSSALGQVKASSEEAAHAVCRECGFSGGRHMQRCPLAPKDAA